ncbi:MAG: hypothetical protein IJ575_10595 [Selenomonadaceae bacterium]|nr:hypothetical protein [Selenomonadaceae bacterium]
MIPLLIGAAAAAAGIAIASSSDDEKSTSQSESKRVKAVDESRVPAHIMAKMQSHSNSRSYSASDYVSEYQISEDYDPGIYRAPEAYTELHLESVYDLNQVIPNNTRLLERFESIYESTLEEHPQLKPIGGLLEIEIPEGSNISRYEYTFYVYFNGDPGFIVADQRGFSIKDLTNEARKVLEKERKLSINFAHKYNANRSNEENIQREESVIDRCMNEIRREIDSRGSRGIGYYGGTVKLRYMDENKFKLSYELYFSDDDLSKSYTFDFDQLPPDARRQLRNEKIVSFDLNDNQDQSQDLAAIHQQGGISGSTAVVQNQSLIPRWARSRLMTTDGQLVVYIKNLSNAELDELINSGAI